MILTYTGTSNKRVIRVTDVEKHLKLEDFTEVVWQGNEPQEVPDALGEWLLNNYSHQFALSEMPESTDNSIDDDSGSISES